LVLFTNLDRFLFSFLVSLNFMDIDWVHDDKTGLHRFPSLIRQNHLNELTELDLVWGGVAMEALVTAAQAVRPSTT